jgi:hypothetical protein
VVEGIVWRGGLSTKYAVSIGGVEDFDIGCLYC